MNNPLTATRILRPLLAALSTLAFAAPAPAAEPAHWTYGGAGGPEHWAQLSDEFAACALGHEQSPIDIRDARKADLPAIAFDYRPGPLQVVDNGHTIQFNVAPGSSIGVGDDRYQLLQFHFHRPSEERVAGKAFAMVAHLVHRNVAGQLAVVGVLIESGGPNKLLETLWSHLPRKSGYTVALEDETADAAQLLPTARGYYTFAGSLTTPPCSEGVRWFVLKQPAAASPEQITTFARRYPNNARPVQPRNARVMQETSAE